MISIFWISLIALIYTYLGYPLYIFTRAKIAGKNVNKDMAHKPFVSVIISAYNEEAFIGRKINNLLQSDYPEGKMEILIGSDGSKDRTNDILVRLSDSRVRAFIFGRRRGKPSVLNELVPKARGEILVFCDVRQAFDKNAISRLAANFADERVGCVSGELIFNGGYNNGVSEGVGIYWDYEKMIRRSESAVHSMAGATGAIYAIRKELYSPPPADTILDDMYIPLSVARRGYRSIWDSEARAYDRPAFTPQEEYRRKVRTLAGNYQIFMMFKDLLIPFKSAVAIPLLSHKLLRISAPLFIIFMFIANLVIARRGLYGAFLIGQMIFYILAIIGSVTYKNGSKRLIVKLASTIYMFCLMNFTALAGLYRFMFHKQEIAWEK